VNSNWLRAAVELVGIAIAVLLAATAFVAIQYAGITLLTTTGVGP
jgi:hypothetical protein